MRNARVRDAIVELPNGDLLMPLHGFRWQRTMPDIASAERERAFVLWSPNRGKTWHYYGTMGYDPAEIAHYHEPGLLRLRDGRLLGLMRALSRAAFPTSSMPVRTASSLIAVWGISRFHRRTPTCGRPWHGSSSRTSKHSAQRAAFSKELSPSCAAC